MQHLAIIPDGNRRWALQNKLETFLGHQHGKENIRTAIKVCIKNGIKYLSFYTFSLENFKRSQAEKSYLFSLLANEIPAQLDELIEQGVRVRFIGNHALFPEQVKKAIQFMESATQHLDKLHMSLLFCYGGKDELLHMVKAVAQKVKDGVLDVHDITEQTIYNNLWTAGIPDPDLIIRTGGVARLSNFLLFQAAYSELSFLNCYWPEVTQAHLEQCIDQFNNTKRNFGR
jgi:undecaprenyl diphosphate synthase